MRARKRGGCEGEKRGGCEGEEEGRPEVEAVRARKSGPGLGRGASQARPREDSEEGKVIFLGR